MVIFMYRDLIKNTKVTICSALSKVDKVTHLVFLTYTNGNKYSDTVETPNPKPCQPSHHLTYYQFDTMQRNVSLNLESYYHFYTWDKL